MGFFSDFTSYKYADFAKKNDEIGVPKTASNTIEDTSLRLKRVPRLELERMYREDAQAFKMVNSYERLLLQAGYRIIADNKTNQKQYDDFFKNMGRVGMHYKLEQLLGRIIHDAVLYGHAYVERVYDVGGNYIVDLKPVDAKLMDYVRDMKEMIMTDEEQNPLGYTMNVGFYSDAKTDPPPKGSKVLPGYIFLRPERIAPFLLCPYGNGFEAIGLVEPAYKQINRKMKIEETASNAIFNAADSLQYAIVGDPTTRASQELMNATLDTLKKWSTNRRAVFAYPTQINKLDIEQSPQVPEMLKYLRQDQAIAGGMSASMAIGSGESNNKSTMGAERKDFNTMLNAVAYDIAEQFRYQILDKLYEVNGYGSKAVMVWNNVSVEDRQEMVALIKTLYDMNAITPTEARNYAKNVFDLETDDEEYKEYINQTKYLPEMPDQTEADDQEGQTKLTKDKKGNPLQVKKNILKSKDKYEENRE